MAFDPDAYLAEKTGDGGFNPDAYLAEKEQPSFMSQAGDIANRYVKSQFGSPQSLLNSVQPLFSKATGWLGQKATEALSQPDPMTGQKVDPYTAAGVGTVISMGPDIMMSGINPLSEEAAASKQVPEVAKGYARRALGFQKSLLKTPFARGQAQNAAQTALENNVIPWSGSPTSMFGKAAELANKSGTEIGQTLQSVPVDTKQLQQSFYDLENLKQSLTQGTQGGVFSKAENAINDIQDTISQLNGRQGLTVQTLNSLKTRVGNSVNYLADLASQSDNKQIVATLGNTIRNLVKAGVAPEEYLKYLSNQKIFSSSKLMLKGLNNEVAGQAGNRMFSPYSVIPAAGEIAAGQPLKAAATLGLTEGVLRRGAGTTARGITEVSRALPAMPEVISKALVLIKDKAREFLDQANGNKDLARQLAKKEGYQW